MIIVFILKVLLYIVMSFLPIIIIGGIVLFIISLPGHFIGISRANTTLKKEINKVKITNPYIYYRDIPNDYGIGVYAILLDFKLNIRDLKAAIIDLSAKGYIKITISNNGFNIKLTDKDSTSLLENEKYILNWLKSKHYSLKSLNLKKWKEEILKDIGNLGLAQKRNVNIKNENTRGMLRNKIAKIILILALISTYIYLYYNNVGIIKYEHVEGLIKNILFFITWLIVNIPIAGGIAFLSFMIFMIIGSLFLVAYYSEAESYYFKINNELQYTEETKDVLQKIYSLGAFLKDFSNFADKDISEVTIWERYFSYAYLFGLNKKLSSKYQSIYKNDCFDLNRNIDSIENVLILK